MTPRGKRPTTVEGDRAQELFGSMLPGHQYALVKGLRDPAFPFITFIIEIPFAIKSLPPERVVVPLSGYRLGEPDDTEVRVKIAEVSARGLPSAAVVNYLLGLDGRAPADRKLLRGLQSRIQPSPTRAWVAELTTPNVLPGLEEANNSEIAARLFDRCLFALNRFLGAYLVAAEDYAVRPLRLEALGEYALVELRNAMGHPKGLGGILILPKATPPDSGYGLDDHEIAERLRTSMKHELVKHPMDRVVAWERRAAYHSWIGGDYEMSIIALMVSAEALVTAVWRTQQVDRGFQSDDAVNNQKDSYSKPPPFRRALQNVADAFDDSWTRESSDGPVAALWRDCYAARNEAVHEGAYVTHDILDVAFAAYTGFRRWVEQKTLEFAPQFPRTAILIHGPVGLAQHPEALAHVTMTLEEIRRNRELAFWLPPDEPRRF